MYYRCLRNNLVSLSQCQYNVLWVVSNLLLKKTFVVTEDHRL